jgi:hypothetical protein
MQALRDEGTSYNEIAQTLDADRVPTKRNGPWGSQTVKNILELATSMPPGRHGWAPRHVRMPSGPVPPSTPRRVPLLPQ